MGMLASISCLNSVKVLGDETNYVMSYVSDCVCRVEPDTRPRVNGMSRKPLQINNKKHNKK